jgi:hypothetical protein
MSQKIQSPKGLDFLVLVLVAEINGVLVFYLLDRVETNSVNKVSTCGMSAPQVKLDVGFDAFNHRTDFFFLGF